MSLFGNYSKMVGGGMGGILSAIATTQFVIPAFAPGNIFSNCQAAIGEAIGNWTGTLSSVAVAGILGAITTYFFPKNKPDTSGPTFGATGSRLR